MPRQSEKWLIVSEMNDMLRKFDLPTLSLTMFERFSIRELLLMKNWLATVIRRVR